MRARRSRELNSPPPDHGSGSLVPATLNSPLGILSVATLQFLLGSGEQHQPRQHHTTNRHQSGDDDRPASSELARAYGVSRDDAVVPAPRRRVPAADAKRRAAPLKLDPVDATPSPLRRHRSRPQRAPHDRALHRDVQQAPAAKEANATWSAPPICANEQRLLEEAPRNPVVNPSAHLHLPAIANRDDTLSRLQSPSKSPGATSELIATESPVRLAHRRSLGAPSNNETHNDDDLRRQVQWIHDHLPVRRLANAKCSLALRGKIFVDTMRTNLLRGSMRSALMQWTWVVATLRQMDLAKLKALDRLAAVYEHAARDQVAHRFGLWIGFVEGCRDMERLAAVVSIQRWLVWCRQRHEGRQSIMALSVARALTTANANAARIQRQYRVHAAKQKLKNALHAVTTIQRQVRATRQRRLYLEQKAATRKLEALYAQLRRNEQLELLTMRSRDRNARRIATMWREYAAWRAQLVRDYVASMVDQVEFFAAVMSIQRHIRGYQCRFRMKRKTRACLRIQRAWRQSVTRHLGRKQRKMLLLTQNMAASCLQRTFQRNRERKKYRLAMKKSSRPMFLRAVGASASFRDRFLVPIVKSAISVIQSSWRRHAAYARWKQHRVMAARRIQLWQRRVRIWSTWQRTAHNAMAAHRATLRHGAARRLQRWLVACTRLQVESKRASAARQLFEMLQSVMTIQRYYRRKKDRWRRLLRHVIQDELPRSRHASKTIQKCWRTYADKKHQLLSLYGSHSELPRSVGLHALQDYLTRQQREMNQRSRAARVIQKAYRQRLARREGKLLLKKYRVLFQRELRRRQQRGVIHGFLVERQDARALRQQQTRASPSPVSVSVSSSSPASSAASPGSVGTPTLASPQETLEETPDATDGTGNGTDGTGAAGDDPDVVQCWSDEHQSFYWFNARTGEATWCS